MVEPGMAAGHSHRGGELASPQPQQVPYNPRFWQEITGTHVGGHNRTIPPVAQSQGGRPCGRPSYALHR